MNFRPRKSASSSGSRRRQQNDRSYSIRSHMLVYHPSSKQGNHTLRSGLVQASPFIMLRRRWQLVQATIMANLGDPLEVLTGIRKVGIQVVGITRIVEVKVVDTTVVHIHSKDVDRHPMLGVVCLVLVVRVVEVAAAMESMLPIIPKVALTVLRVLAEVLT